MSLFGSMRTSASGMSVERYRMDVTAGNLAHADNEGLAPGQKPFARQMVEVEETDQGVRVIGQSPHPDGVIQKHMPGHAGSDADGMVWVTNVNPVTEMVDMMGATRAYEANVKAFNAAKGMAKSALEIGKA